MFSDPIVGGDGELIIDRIHSAGFVTGVAGWDIEKNGAAEFQNLTARGDLSGSTITIPTGATVGQRIVIDQFGIHVYDATNTVVVNITPGSMAAAVIQGRATNASRAGLPLPNTSEARIDSHFTGILDIFSPIASAAAASQGDITLTSDEVLDVPADQDFSGTLVNLHGSGIGGGNRAGQLRLYQPTKNVLKRLLALVVRGGTGNSRIVRFGDIPGNLGNSPFDIIETATPYHTLTNPDVVQFGNGPAGGYSSGNWTWSESRASNTLASIAAVTLTQLNSDYGSSFTGGVITPPVEGYYDIFFFMGAVSGATREACIIRKNGVEIAHNEAPNATNLATFVISEYLLTTDAIDFRPFYVSATTPQTLNGRINVSRRL